MATADKTTLNTGSGGSAIDTVDVTTGAGAVQRQIVAIADATAATQYAAVDAQGNLAVTTVITTFKTVTATASGDTAIWTPASGKKFQLMRCLLQITANAAMSGGGVLEVILRDVSTAIGIGLSVYVPTVGATTFGNTVSTPWMDLGDGYISSAINQSLNVNLSAALTSGEVRAVACGIEI